MLNLDDTGTGSLRQALTDAAASDTIVFNSGLTGTLLLASTLSINKDLAITGPGSDLLTVSGNNAVQDFYVAAGVSATISEMTIAQGNASSGGGICNNGTLIVSNSTLSGNSAAYGGGIFSQGTLTVSNSTLSGNSASNGGGGIYSFATLTVSNSTLSHNSASLGGGILNNANGTVIDSTLSGNSTSGVGGGIYNNGGKLLTVSSSTFSGNSASSDGGGIMNQGYLTVTNSTFNNNVSNRYGGAISNIDTPLTVTNSTLSGNSGYAGGGLFTSGSYPAGGMNNIIAQNSASSSAPDVSGYFTSQGHNLIGDGTGADGFTAAGDQVGTTATPIDPMLGPPQDNGGPTQTMALLPGSPAIDAGDDSVLDPPLSLTTDQRGQPRSAHVDIGAFEASTPPAIPLYGFDGIMASEAYLDPLSSPPPDSDGAVGPFSFIEVVNNAIAIYPKIGPPSGALISLAGLFKGRLGELGTLTDPLVVYNDIIQRFFVAALDYSISLPYPSSSLDVAVSTSNNPESWTSKDWTIRRFDLFDGVGTYYDFADYPKVGYNADGYVVSFNMYPDVTTFDPNHPPVHDHVSTIAIPNGLTSAVNKEVNIVGPINPSSLFTLAPATMHSASPGGAMWFVYVSQNSADEEGNAAGNNVEVLRMDNPFKPSMTTVTSYSVPVDPFSITAAPHQPDGQLTKSGLNDPNLGTRMYFSALRTVAGITHLVAAHTVGDGSGYSQVRWYDFNTNGTPTLYQYGKVSGGTDVDTFLPAMDIGPDGSLGLQYAQSSADSRSGYMSMYATGRLPSDALNTMRTPLRVRDGSANINPHHRVGDYSFTSVDPVDGSFWGTNEYANTEVSGDTVNWRTWIQQFSLSPKATGTFLASSTNPSIPGQPVTFVATVTPAVASNVTPTGSVDFVDTSTNTDLGAVPLIGSIAMLPPLPLSLGTHVIYASYSGDGNFASSSGPLTQTVTRSIFVLNLTANGSLSVSNTASVLIPGNIIVDSNSNTALAESNSAQITAASIQVVGGVSISAKATASPVPTTGVAVVPDPLAGLPVPSFDLMNPLVIDLTKGTLTINPGVYSHINVSGNTAKLTMNPGVYIIVGGGFALTSGGSVTGNGVTIYNTADANGKFGGITLSGSGTFNLTAPSSGPDPGVLIFQDRSNTRALAFGYNAGQVVSGTVYAKAAQMAISGTASVDGALVVDKLSLSSSGVSTLTVDGGDSSEGTAGQLLAGNLLVYINDPNSLFTTDEQARIQDAVNAVDGIVEPYGVSITETTDSSAANVIVDTGSTSAAGSYADGVLGCYTSAGEITLIQGWNWYAGSDAGAVGSGQYDFETAVVHELGHALGLGHSGDSTSVMYGVLATGVAKRVLTTTDLAIPDFDAGADALHAAAPPMNLAAAGKTAAGLVVNRSVDNAARPSDLAPNLLLAFLGAELSRGTVAASLAGLSSSSAARDAVFAAVPAQWPPNPDVAIPVARSSQSFVGQQPRGNDELLLDVPLFPGLNQDAQGDGPKSEGSSVPPVEQDSGFIAANPASQDF